MAFGANGSPGGQPGLSFRDISTGGHMFKSNSGRKAVFDLPQRSPNIFELTKMSMKAFLYECPTHGLQVQGWVEEENSSHTQSNQYITFKCLLCARTHLVNPATSHVLGSDRKPKTE